MAQRLLRVHSLSTCSPLFLRHTHYVCEINTQVHTQPHLYYLLDSWKIHSSQCSHTSALTLSAPPVHPTISSQMFEAASKYFITFVRGEASLRHFSCLWWLGAGSYMYHVPHLCFVFFSYAPCTFVTFQNSFLYKLIEPWIILSINVRKLSQVLTAPGYVVRLLLSSNQQSKTEICLTYNDDFPW